MRRVLWILVAVFVVIFVWAISTTPLFPNQTAAIVDFFRSQAKKGLYTTAVAEPLEPFHIDVEGSFQACPNLARNAAERWRSVLEQMMPEQPGSDFFYGEVVRIHLIETGYTLFVIDRKSRACVEEVPLGTFDITEARRAAERRRILRGSNIWQRIDPQKDWTYVYSGELGSDEERELAGHPS